MPARTTPPFRADHVGSLLRAPKLKQARDDVKAGKLPASELRRLEQDEIRRVVKKQEEIGLKLVTDGDFPRDTWYLDFIFEIGSVEKIPSPYTLQFKGSSGKIEGNVPHWKVGGKINLGKTIFGEDFAFLKSVATATPKQTLPSPTMMHFRGAGMNIDPKIYADVDAYRQDVAAVYADQLAGLGKLGCTYVQLDDTIWGFANDPAWRERFFGAGSNAKQILENFAGVFNKALAKKPAGMTVCMHVCRGNYKSGWMTEGGYDDVADILFNRTDVDGYFLEFDDPRSGTFEPLRFVPKNKTVVLGLVTSKTPELESKDAIKRRIDDAAKYVPLERLALSPQCGFASTIEGNLMTEEQQFAKLRLVADIAREVWGSA